MGIGLRWEGGGRRRRQGVELGSGKRERVEEKVGAEDLEVKVEVGRGGKMVFGQTWVTWL